MTLNLDVFIIHGVTWCIEFHFVMLQVLLFNLCGVRRVG
jgi:hypothetical protein